MVSVIAGSVGAPLSRPAAPLVCLRSGSDANEGAVKYSYVFEWHSEQAKQTLFDFFFPFNTISCLPQRCRRYTNAWPGLILFLIAELSHFQDSLTSLMSERVIFTLVFAAHASAWRRGGPARRRRRHWPRASRSELCKLAAIPCVPKHPGWRRWYP